MILILCYIFCYIRPIIENNIVNSEKWKVQYIASYYLGEENYVPSEIYTSDVTNTVEKEN